MRRKIIPYHPGLKVLARKLRNEMTFSEVKLWNRLKTSQMLDYDFDRQRPIGNYIVDFYCKDLLLAVEIDGITHDDESVASNDEIRQQELERLGVQFLRFSALQVVHDIDSVMRGIVNWIVDYEERYGVPGHIERRRSVQ
ncbi:MAG: endonuclease domain-containing protein [Chitinophagaceae bacterium]